MSDKYANLRPARQRRCYRSDLMPKKRYAYKEAHAVAEQYPGYHAYRCPDCDHWHVGRKREGET